MKGAAMVDKKTTSERLAAFSDAVFAVIITIMVLDLRPPEEATLRALARIWPLALSYAVSYFFIAIIWVNHHHLLTFARNATPNLIWWNFAHLFMVSLVPVTTAWMARTRLVAAPVFVYALVFVMVELAYIAFERTAFTQATRASCLPEFGGSRLCVPISHSACSLRRRRSHSGRRKPGSDWSAASW